MHSRQSLIIPLLYFTGMYSCKRMMARWLMGMFLNVIDVSAYSAFVVWSEINPRWKEGKNYKETVLCETWQKHCCPTFKGDNLPYTSPSAAFSNIHANQRGKRQKKKVPTVCTKRQKKTSFVCHGCGAYICKEHVKTSVYCPTCS